MNKHEEFKEWCKTLTEKANEEKNKCQLIATNIFNRAIEGKITIVDEKNLSEGEMITVEQNTKRLNESLENFVNEYDMHFPFEYFGDMRYKNCYDDFKVFFLHKSNIFQEEPNSCLIDVNVDIIDSVSNFIERVIRSKSDITSYYRGQGNWKYELEPGIYRNGREDTLKHESLYIREIVSMYPQYFKDCESALDYLSVLQHNGFPTRLLDFTENPLVALYMACCSGKDTHADVIEIKVESENIKYYDSDTVAILSNLAWFDDDFSYDKSVGTKEFNNEVKRFVHQIRNEKPYFEAKILPSDLSRIIFVKSKHNFERISRQSGLFALFGIDCSKSTRPEIEKMKGIKKITHYIIPASKKSEILSELDYIGINQANLYCDLANIAQYYTNDFRNDNILKKNKEIERSMNPFNE